MTLKELFDSLEGDDFVILFDGDNPIFSVYPLDGFSVQTLTLLAERGFEYNDIIETFHNMEKGDAIFVSHENKQDERKVILFKKGKRCVPEDKRKEEVKTVVYLSEGEAATLLKMLFSDERIRKRAGLQLAETLLS